MTVEDKYNQLCLTPSDIWEHLSSLKRYAEQSESIIELGVRKVVSTWALLAGKPKWMWSVDIVPPEEHGSDTFEVFDLAFNQGTDWQFLLKSSLEIELPQHDFLFIDTLHTYEQLTKELEKHSPRVRKFIAMHDTHIPGLDEMGQAVSEFLTAHPEWQIAEDRLMNNGMTFLKRV